MDEAVCECTLVSGTYLCVDLICGGADVWS